MNPLRILADAPMMPPPASNLAADVDWAWTFILVVTTIFFCIVVGAMTLFVFKYRRRTPNDKTSEITHNTPLEIAWTAIPLAIVIGFFFVGFKGFLNYDTPLGNSVAVDVMARKWNFTFTYPNGAVAPDLYVIKDVPFVMNLQSQDVLHGFYIPAFRTQRNLIPGRTTNVWFIATRISPTEGFPIFCTQYCGDAHSKMYTWVHVLDKAGWDEKMKELANPFKEKDAAGHSHWVPYTKIGEKLYHQSGCATCHSVDGSKIIGPTWKNLYKSDVRFSASNVPGYSLSSSDPDDKWEAYLRESILQPDAKIVESYNNVMPSFAAQFSGDAKSPKDEELRALIAYIKSIGSTGWKPATSPEDNPDLYDADKNPNHPESLAAHDAAPAQTK
ncbi:MAG TPA: cytochrome c oxidase subunit II [Phycisphaerae bacterium]|nr:cytochrome c oxidase subunit II [Phycisphaerae bacterium]